uniref:Dehydrogenase/reductase SDR family member 4 n=1 Tax=Strigamia maritima TaxID=126957 RepID=T1JIM0_STRMM
MNYIRSLPPLKSIVHQTMPMTSIRWAQTSSSVTKRLNGKIAIVTASTKGIGLATADRLAEEGARVIISSRNQSNVKAAVETLRRKGLDVNGVVCHVSKQEDRNKLIEKALELGGKIDIFISNAAANPTAGHVLDTEEGAWDKIFDINVKSAFLLSKEVLPHLSKGGCIVYISSIAGLQLFPMIATYSVSKTALCALSRAVAAQCAPLGIRVNCVSPGIVKTDFSSVIWQNKEGNEQLMSSIPMDRIAEPYEVAGLVAFLCSDDASYITGENYVVAGGMPSRL